MREKISGFRAIRIPGMILGMLFITAVLQAGPPDSINWELVWYDEFDGESP